MPTFAPGTGDYPQIAWGEPCKECAWASNAPGRVERRAECRSCEICRGTRRVPVNAPAAVTPIYRVPCPTCYGSGHQSAGWNGQTEYTTMCFGCKGTGLIEIAIQEAA